MKDSQKGDGQGGWRLVISNTLSKQFALEPWYRSRFQYSKSIPYCIIVVVAIAHTISCRGSQNKAKEVGPSAITSSALFGVYEDMPNSQSQLLWVLSSTPVLPLLRGHLALLGEAVTYRPYRLRHALFGCKALICRCNCIGFKTSQISNNTTAYFKCQHFALFFQAAGTSN